MYSKYVSAAVRIAEQLFSRLLGKPRRKGVIHVRCAQYTRQSKEIYWIVALIVPLSDADFRVAIGVANAHRRYHYPATIINTNQGPSLMLAFRVWKKDAADLDGETWARAAGTWFSEMFEMPFIPSTIRGQALARWVFRETYTPRFGT